MCPLVGDDTVCMLRIGFVVVQVMMVIAVVRIWSYIVCRQFDETLFCSTVTRSNVGVENIVLYEFGVTVLDPTEGESILNG